MLLRKAYRDLVTRRIRSALTLLGVIIGVAGLVAIVSTNQGFARAQEEAFATGYRADLAIYLHNGPASLIRVIERVPGVLAADLRLTEYGRGRLSPEEEWTDIRFLGLRNFTNQQVERVVLVRGQWPDAGEALIEPSAADRHKVEVGDRIYYRDFSNRARSLRVSGVARLPIALSADITGIPMLFVPDPVVREMVDAPGYNELLVRLQDDTRRQEVADGIIANLDQRNIPHGSPRFSDPENFPGKRELDALFLILYLFSGLGILLSGFIVANTLAALVVESIREIGIMKSLGATRRQILTSFLLASSLYGLVGTLLGLLLGSGLGYLLLKLLGRVAMIEPVFRIEPLAVLLGSGVGLIVTLLSGMVPAWQAAAVTPKAALESQGVSRNFGRSRFDQFVQHLAQLPPLLAMGVRNLVRRKWRSLITLVVVAFAVAALLAAQSTDRSVGVVIEDIFQTYVADGYLRFEESASAREEGALRRVEGVTHVEPWLMRNCTAGYARTRCWAMPADTRLYRPDLLAGRWLDPLDSRGVVLSNDLATSQGVGLGDSFLLRYREEERQVRIRGIVRDNAIFLGSDIQSKVFVPRALFAPMAGSGDEVDVFAFSLAPRTQGEQQAILDEIDRKLAPLRPSSTLALREFETSQQQTRILTTALRGMVLLVALVGAAGLINTLAMNVLERRREIGVLRALGTDDRQIGLLFLTEGMALGALGWVLGVAIGWITGFLFISALSTALFTIPYQFPLTFLLTSLAFALILSLVSSVAPAFAAANLRTIEAIRYE